jgi:hypothetical protein
MTRNMGRVPILFLSLTVIEGKCTVYSWLLISNYVHILFKSGRQGISAAEIARHPGVNTSSINRAIERAEDTVTER